MEPLALAIDESVRRRLSAHLDPRRRPSPARLLDTLSSLPFFEAADLLRLAVADGLAQGRIEQTIDTLREIDDRLAKSSPATASLRAVLDLHAMVLAATAALHFDADEAADAARTAASAMAILVQEPRRKDEPFLETLGYLLHTVGRIHAAASEFKQAAREFDKATRVFRRLARTRPQRYTPALMSLQAASVEACDSRMRQTALLERSKELTAECLQLLAGADEASPEAEAAARSLAETLHTEGRTLARMDRHREAVQHISRALRYISRLSGPEAERAKTLMSVDLGEALLHIKGSRDKGLHLLNTMLQKCVRTEELAPEAARIRSLLAESSSRRLDILHLWQKIFPK